MNIVNQKQMSKVQVNSYSELSPIERSQTLLQQQPPSIDRSPFRKQLPTILQSSISPYQRFNNSNIYQQSDYMRQSEQSRLLRQQQFQSLRLSFESGLLGGTQRLLVGKIYEKQKELVLLEERVHLLRNSNQCLRDTIVEGKVEKEELIVELYKVKDQNAELKQSLNKLNKKLNQLQTKLKKNQWQEQEGYFAQNHITPKSSIQITKENQMLQRQVQQIKSMYQQEIYRMTQKNEETNKKIMLRQQQVKQQNQQLAKSLQQLHKELQNVKIQKRQMLQYYLGVIEEMKRQIQTLKSISVTPQTMSQNILINHEDSTLYDMEQENNVSHNYHQKQNKNNQSLYIDAGIIIKIQSQNKLLKQLLSKHISYLSNQSHNNSRKNSKQMNKTNSIQSLNINQHHSFQLNSQHSIPYIYHNHTTTNDRLNNTFVNYMQKSRDNYQKKSTSRQQQRYRLSPSKNISRNYNTNIPKVTRIPARMLINQPITYRHNQGRYRQIDRKLDQIKNQLMKEITY